MQVIYVRLLEEGTEVYRPTEAEPLPDGCFKLLSTERYNSDGESWEFPPGSVVRAVERKFNGDTVLIAFRIRMGSG